MTVALLVGVLVLILVNAFFVSAEFALVRARRSRLEQMADGDARARLAVHEIDEISEYLSACQLGVTLASIGIGFLGEPAVANLIHPWLGGSVSHGVALAISLTVAYVADDRAAHHDRRTGAEDLRAVTGRGRWLESSRGRCTGSRRRSGRS